jgi:hypothetical protein
MLMACWEVARPRARNLKRTGEKEERARERERRVISMCFAHACNITTLHLLINLPATDRSWRNSMLRLTLVRGPNTDGSTA